MRAITLHLNDFVEDQERRRRRAFAFGIIAILLALGAALRKPKPEIQIQVREKIKTNTVTETVVRTDTVVQYRPRVEEIVLPANRPILDFAGLIGARHLCVTPHRIAFGPESTVEHVTISNPGAKAVTITRTALLSDRPRSGLSFDLAGCDGKTLQPGDYCKVGVSLNDRAGETASLWIFNDVGDPEAVLVTSTSRAN